ncbi:MAG: hypothetical protein IKE45_04370 [Halomonas sp.]|nr:hypothetical protein [Halomonas sp.]MBR2513250.1 hypothetical protein [Halomonas sp.]
MAVIEKRLWKRQEPSTPTPVVPAINPKVNESSAVAVLAAAVDKASAATRESGVFFHLYVPIAYLFKSHAWQRSNPTIKKNERFLNLCLKSMLSRFYGIKFLNHFV